MIEDPHLQRNAWTGASRRNARSGCGAVRVVAIAALLGGTAVCGCRAPAPPSVVSSAWSSSFGEGVRLTTEHFEICTTLPPGQLRDVLGTLAESAYRQFQRTLPASTRARTARLRSYVFASRDQWDRFTKAQFPASYTVYCNIRAGGFTERGTAVLFHTTPAATLATFAHEAWHQYVEISATCRPPAWLNEGLACHLESYDFTQTPPRWIPLGNSFRLEQLRSAVAESRTFQLRELLDTHAGEVLLHNDSGVTQTYYACVWGLMAFLSDRRDRARAEGYHRLLSDLADGSLPIRVRAAFLGEPSRTAAGFDRSVFVLYFGAPDEAMEEAYQARLRELAGL